MSEHPKTPEELALCIAAARAQRADMAKKVLDDVRRGKGAGLEEASLEELVAVLFVELQRVRTRLAALEAGAKGERVEARRIIMPGQG